MREGTIYCDKQILSIELGQVCEGSRLLNLSVELIRGWQMHQKLPGELSNRLVLKAGELKEISLKCFVAAGLATEH